MPASLEDVVFLLANYLVEQNGEKLDDVVSAISGVNTNLDRLAQQLGELVSNQDELDTRVAFISTQVQEVLTEIQNLKDQVGANELDFSGLDSAIQPLADAVPDVEPPPEP